VFLGLVVVLASFSYVLIFTAGNDDDRTGGFALLQFSPAISALVTKLVYQRNVRGLGWGWGKTRYQVAGLLLPLALGLVGFSLVWLTVGGFYDGFFIAELQSEMAETLGFDATSPYITMLILTFVSGTVGLLLPGISIPTMPPTDSGSSPASNSTCWPPTPSAGHQISTSNGSAISSTWSSSNHTRHSRPSGSRGNGSHSVRIAVEAYEMCMDTKSFYGGPSPAASVEALHRSRRWTQSYNPVATAVRSC
jgi:hypothetical protein